MYMIMFVLDDVDLLDDILESWAKIGVSGATFFESSGLHRRLRAKLPMRYAFAGADTEETGNITLFVVVENKQRVAKCLESIELVVGNLDEPNTGVFSAWPLTLTKGIPSLEDKEV